MMKYIQMPSLERIALVKIVATLWNQTHFWALTMACFRKYSDGQSLRVEWQKIEETCTERVPQLLLPRLIEDKVLSLIKPIGIQIFEWMRYHYKATHLCIDLPVEFCFTPHGTVDRKRTAQMFIKKENLDTSKRYEWACVYCLVEDIPKLWMKMPNYIKLYFLNQNPFSTDHWQSLVKFWTWNMEMGEINEANFTYQLIFHHSAVAGNKAATEYFFTKLTPVERQQSMNNVLIFVDDPDVLCFLLSEMDEEKQTNYLKNFRNGVLKHFIDWPLQGFFIETVARVWDFLDEKNYSNLFSLISTKRLDGFKDWNYQKLWAEVWEKGSLALKNCVVNAFGYTLLEQLLKSKDKDNCRLMLKDVAAIKKIKLIHVQNYFCKKILYRNQWDQLEFFIQECLSSKDEMLQFKNELEKTIINNTLKDILKNNKHKWDKLFCLSDSSVSKDDKRTVKDGQSSSSKRLRSLQ